MNVVAYCRYSSEAQRDGYSIEAQISAITAFCASKGYNLIHAYIDEAKSGTSDLRDQFQQMINDSSQHTFEAVVVHKLDRFARNRYDSAIYKKKLKDNGVAVFSVLERLDDSPESVIMEGLLEAMSEYYSKNLAREVLKGRNASAAKGNHAGGICPFGYKDVDRRYVVEPTEAVIVKKIFNDYAEGLPVVQIARNLEALGYKTRKGLRFEHAGIASIIRNPIYTGDLHFNKESSVGAPVSIVENACEAIIDKDLFYKCNERLSHPRGRAVPKSKSERNYMLTGLLYCAECGGPITGHSSNRRYKNKDGVSCTAPAYYYKCHNSVSTLRKAKSCDNKKMLRKDDLENYTYRIIKDQILQESTLDFIASEVQNKIRQADNIDSAIATCKKELEKLNLKAERLLDLYLDAKIDKASYNSKGAEITSAKLQIEKKLEGLAIRKAPAFDFNQIKKALSSALSKKDDSAEFKARIIKLFVDNIQVSSTHIEFIFKLPIGPAGSYSCLTERPVYCFSLYTRISIPEFKIGRLPEDPPQVRL